MLLKTCWFEYKFIQYVFVCSLSICHLCHLFSIRLEWTWLWLFKTRLPLVCMLLLFSSTIIVRLFSCLLRLSSSIICVSLSSAPINSNLRLYIKTVLYQKFLIEMISFVQTEQWTKTIMIFVSSSDVTVPTSTLFSSRCYTFVAASIWSTIFVLFVIVGAFNLANCADYRASAIWFIVHGAHGLLLLLLIGIALLLSKTRQYRAEQCTYIVIALAYALTISHLVGMWITRWKLLCMIICSWTRSFIGLEIYEIWKIKVDWTKTSESIWFLSLLEINVSKL
jgi:hypothetical protein